MNHVQRIDIKGMHKVDRQKYQFEHINYISGPNGIGKSTILQAIQLACLGYIPGYKKTNDAIMSHSNCNQLEVNVVHDEGILTRKFTKSKTVKAVKDEDSDAFTEELKLIELPIFNFSEMMNMTANELKTQITKLSGDSDSTINWNLVFANYLKNENSIVQSTIKQISMMDGDLPSVKSAAVYIDDKIKFVKEQIKRLSGALQAQVQYDEDTQFVNEAEVQNQERELTEKLMQISKHNQQVLMYEKYKSDLENYKLRSANYFKLKSEVDAIEEQLKNNPDFDKLSDLEIRKDVITNQINLLQRQMTNVKSGLCPVLESVVCDKLQSKYSELQSQLEKLKLEYDTITEECRPLINEKLKLTNEINFKTSEMFATHFNENEVAPHISDTDIPDDMEIWDETDIKHNLENLRQIVSNIAKNKAIDAQNATYQRELFVYEECLEVLKEFKTIFGINGLQQQMAKQGLSQFSDIVNQYIHRLFGDNVDFTFIISEKSNSFSMGLTKDDGYVQYANLSSGEKCLFMVAFMITVLKLCNPPLDVIMIDDMLDHLDPSNAIILLEAIKDVTEIQFILAGVNELPEMDFVNYIKLA